MILISNVAFSAPNTIECYTLLIYNSLKKDFLLRVSFIISMCCELCITKKEKRKVHSLNTKYVVWHWLLKIIKLPDRYFWDWNKKKKVMVAFGLCECIGGDSKLKIFYLLGNLYYLKFLSKERCYQINLYFKIHFTIKTYHNKQLV